MSKQPLLLDVEPSFEDSPGGGLIIRKDQIITEDFLRETHEKRIANASGRLSEMHEVAEIPTAVVEVWKSQGFDIISDRNIKARDIVKRLRSEGLEMFVTTDRRV